MQQDGWALALAFVQANGRDSNWATRCFLQPHARGRRDRAAAAEVSILVGLPERCIPEDVPMDGLLQAFPLECTSKRI